MPFTTHSITEQAPNTPNCARVAGGEKFIGSLKVHCNTFSKLIYSVLMTVITKNNSKPAFSNMLDIGIISMLTILIKKDTSYGYPK